MTSTRSRADVRARAARGARSRASSSRPQRLLTRDFASDINAPDQSRLTDDQWLIADLLTNLEQAFFERNLSPPRRRALARMQVEWQKAELGGQDLRVLRAVQAVEHAMAELHEDRTRAASGPKQKKATRKL